MDKHSLKDIRTSAIESANSAHAKAPHQVNKVFAATRPKKFGRAVHSHTIHFPIQSTARVTPRSARVTSDSWSSNGRDQ